MINVQVPAVHEDFQNYFLGLQAISAYDDRACAIVAGAMLDDGLKYLLKKLKLSAAGDFCKRIERARTNNILSVVVCDDLDRIRNVRNVFSHSRVSITFSTDEILAECAKIQLPDLITQEFSDFQQNVGTLIVPGFGNAPKESLSITDGSGFVAAIADPDPWGGVMPKPRFVWAAKLIWLRILVAAYTEKASNQTEGQ